ncbi:hypothetical protein [Pelagibaculum spongiae]|uniref:Uncharacterized protein n=1 Tax=Pelagibaculum spongiae TaxID=2080658 RepID=A0A2V1GRF3_9GAMM|nr:hypothetical protein [Pelagibaculum spongiae]PVZ63879.1 hypothetical protein DC094_20335 [Pelagibaculum spongiae]
MPFDYDQLARQAGCSFEPIRNQIEYKDILSRRFPNIPLHIGYCFGMCSVFIQEGANPKNFDRQLSQFPKVVLVSALQAEHTNAFHKIKKNDLDISDIIKPGSQIFSPGFIIDHNFIDHVIYPEKKFGWAWYKIVQDCVKMPGIWLIILASKSTAKHAIVINSEVSKILQKDVVFLSLFDSNSGVFTAKSNNNPAKISNIATCLDHLIKKTMPTLIQPLWHLSLRYNKALQIAEAPDWQITEPTAP